MNKKFNGKWLFQNEQFEVFCKAVCSSPFLFDNFKTHPIFCQIIGNDIRNREIALECLNGIKNGQLLEKIDIFKTNCKVGNPLIYNLPIVGDISPGTIYFLSILDRLLSNFGNIDDMRICEIGVGYGGQANCILLSGVKEYTCIDTPTMIDFSRRYLQRFSHENVCFFSTEGIDTSRSYDLVISNWCLSEFDKPGLDFYLENVISNANFGYFEMNIWDTDRLGYLVQRLTELFRRLIIVPEIVKTNPNQNLLFICSN